MHKYWKSPNADVESDWHKNNQGMVRAVDNKQTDLNNGSFIYLYGFKPYSNVIIRNLVLIGIWVTYHKYLHHRNIRCNFYTYDLQATNTMIKFHFHDHVSMSCANWGLPTIQSLNY